MERATVEPGAYARKPDAVTATHELGVNNPVLVNMTSAFAVAPDASVTAGEIVP
jgi:hypothetical protein